MAHYVLRKPFNNTRTTFSSSYTPPFGFLNQALATAIMFRQGWHGIRETQSTGSSKIDLSLSWQIYRLCSDFCVMTCLIGSVFQSKPHPRPFEFYCQCLTPGVFITTVFLSSFKTLQQQLSQGMGFAYSVIYAPVVLSYCLTWILALPKLWNFFLALFWSGSSERMLSSEPAIFIIR